MTELFEVEMTSCIKIYLGLNNQEEVDMPLNPTNQPTNLVRKDILPHQINILWTASNCCQNITKKFASSARAVEYTDCTSA